MNKSHGFTLVEMLVSMAILGILTLAFTQIFGGSLRASSEINARNELISEGQIAQQLIASRLQSAYFIYPTGQTMQLTGSGNTTPNTVRSGAGQNWIVGTDPFIAMILPPKMLPPPSAGTPARCPLGSASASVKDDNKQFCFTFYAYYPILRSTFIGTNPLVAPAADPTNANVWFLMEYRANLYDGVDRTADRLLTPPNTATILTNSASISPTIKGKAGQILVDYVQPSNITPTYTMFTVKTATPAICTTATAASDPDACNSWAELDLRLLQNRGGEELRVPPGNSPFATPTPTLSTRVYPRNWN